MKKLHINLDVGGWHNTLDGKTKFIPHPDVRPLNERIKRPKVSKKFDPLQKLLFDNSMKNCIG